MRWRVALGIVAFVSMYSAIVVRQAWTSGWLPAMVSIFVITIIARPKLAVAFVVAAGLAILVRPGLLSSVFLGGDNQFSLTTRYAAWGVLWEIIRLNPILGLGPANYHSYTPFFDFLGFSMNFSSHNNYVDIVAQTGLAGLACFLWFVWETAKLIWRLKSKVPEGFPRAYVIGAMGALAGTLVAGMLGDWILPFVYNIGLEGFRASGLGWMFLGAVVALEHITKTPSSDPRASQGDTLRPAGT
jgi:O-antigen ligase